MANTWTSLLNRYGFETSQEGANLDVTALTIENRSFLESILDTAQVNFIRYPTTLQIQDEVMEGRREMAGSSRAID